MTETVEFEEVSPEDAFSLLGNETRIEIIRVLWDIGDGVSFSELRDHTDVADSGQFNYHLGKLVGTFVQHDEDGYELTYAGWRISVTIPLEGDELEIVLDRDLNTVEQHRK